MVNINKKLSDFVNSFSVKNKFKEMDCVKIVDKSKVKNTFKFSRGSLEYWRLKVEDYFEWTDIPYKETNDPFFGISAKHRWALANRNELVDDWNNVDEWTSASNRESISKSKTKKDTPSEEDCSEWHKLYCSEWYEELEKTDPELFKTQAEIVLMYSERRISLRKGLELAYGQVFKRGSKGYLIPERALELLPENYCNRLKDNLKEHGHILCQIKGVLLTLNEDMIRYPKKQK